MSGAGFPSPSETFATADLVVTEADVVAAYDRLARAITADLADKNPLVLCVMNGGLFATAEIARRLAFPLEMDYLHATRYRGATEGGGLVWERQPPAEKLAGRHLLVIDDILDEGHTLVAIRRALAEFSPASLRVAVLADKRHDRRAPGAFAEYVGVELPDRYVFGCGMDVREHWRQPAAIYAVQGM